MAKQLINLGSSENRGDGDPLRTAFTKINNNFDEVYQGPSIYTQEEIDNITPVPGMLIYNATTGKFQGFAEDSGDSTAGWVDLH